MIKNDEITFNYGIPCDFIKILNKYSNITKLHIISPKKNIFYPLGKINLEDIKYINYLNISIHDTEKDYYYFPNISDNIKKLEIIFKPINGNPLLVMDNLPNNLSILKIETYNIPKLLNLPINLQKIYLYSEFLWYNENNKNIIKKKINEKIKLPFCCKLYINDVCIEL